MPVIKETTVCVALESAQRLTAEALRMTRSLDGAPYDHTSNSRDRAKAEIARDLLRVANLLRHAAAEAEAQWFIVRGYPDPRAEDR
jgi:hypothetical protein